MSGHGLRFGRTLAIATVAIALMTADGSGVAGAFPIPPEPAAATTAAATAADAATVALLPLKGKIVGIDPGHNGLTYTDPA